MNAASWTHARILNNAVLFFNRKRPDLRWVVDFDFKRLSPDGLVLVRPDLAGFDETGALNFVVEVAYSTVQSDLTVKKEFYRQAGAQSYVVIDCQKRKTLLFGRMPDGLLELLTVSMDGLDVVFDGDVP